jgi:LacI family transcriptional regulator
MKQKRTSLEDIAKAVGVSKATVSFVLNGKGDQFNISKEKQTLIHQKAKELMYVPNFFAKSLRHGETKTVGLVVSDISNPFYAKLCKTIQEQLHKKGYTVFIVNTDEDKELEKVLMHELMQRAVDGMIISPSNTIDALTPILEETHIPIVFADRQGDQNADFVGVDNYEEARKLVHQFSKKPNKLAVILKSDSMVITLEERVQGAKAACKELGISMELVHLPTEQALVDEKIRSLTNSGFDSFLVLNNVVVLKILAGLKNNKIELGKKVRLICFDDDEIFEFINPPITALRQPIVEIGIHAVEQLFKQLQEKHKPGKHNLRKCELIIRSSH